MTRRTLVVLGGCRFDGVEVSAPLTAAQRRLLQRLALAAPHSVRLHELSRAVWEGDPPNHLKATIQNQVSRIRASHGESVLLTTSDGYRLGVTTDAQTLQDCSAEAERRLRAGDPQAAYELADAGARLEVGRAFPDLDHVAGVEAIRRSLTAAHRAAENLRLEAALELGRHGWCLTEAERLAGTFPLDERRQAMLARALILAGRRGDALAVLLSTRRALREELGIDFGPLLKSAEDEILRPVARVPLAVSGELVGRRSQIRAVVSAVARHRVAEVIGEPGIGVSRILVEVRSQLRAIGLRPVLVAAEEHQDAAAGVLRAVLRELGLEPCPRGPVSGFVDAVARTGVAGGPVSILIDDAEALGPTTRTVLARACELDHVRLVLGGHHATWPGASERVSLPALGRGDAARMALAQGRVLSSVDLDRLLDDSGGNPAVLQILLAGSLPSGDDVGASTLGALVADLLADLSSSDRRFVERAAVAGDGFPVSLLDPPTPPSPSLFRVDPDGGVHFRHGALREEIRNSLLPARREDLHAQLGAAARAAGQPASLVARHFLAAGSLAVAEAVEACREAAQESTRLGAHADAADWLSSALSSADVAPEDRSSLLVSLGDALRRARDPLHLPVQRDALEEASRLGCGEEVCAEESEME